MTTTAPPVAKPEALRTHNCNSISESKSDISLRIKPRLFSSPCDDDEGEFRKKNHNRDSEDGDCDLLGAVGKVTAHAVGGSVPSPFTIYVSSGPWTRVETSS